MNVRDERVVLRPAFELEDMVHGIVTARIGTEAVHRLRMKGDDVSRRDILLGKAERMLAHAQNLGSHGLIEGKFLFRGRSVVGA